MQTPAHPAFSSGVSQIFELGFFFFPVFLSELRCSTQSHGSRIFVGAGGYNRVRCGGRTVFTTRASGNL